MRVYRAGTGARKITNEDTQGRPVMKCWQKHIPIFVRLIWAQDADPKRGNPGLGSRQDRHRGTSKNIPSLPRASEWLSDNCFRSAPMAQWLVKRLVLTIIPFPTGCQTSAAFTNLGTKPAVSRNLQHNQIMSLFRNLAKMPATGQFWSGQEVYCSTSVVNHDGLDKMMTK